MTSAPALFLSFPVADRAVVALVIDWHHRDSRHEQNPCPLVALEVEGAPGVWDRPHVLNPARLAESVVSDDPESARSVINQRWIAEWLDGEHETETEENVA